MVPGDVLHGIIGGGGGRGVCEVDLPSVRLLQAVDESVVCGCWNKICFFQNKNNKINQNSILSMNIIQNEKFNFKEILNIVPTFFFSGG